MIYTPPTIGANDDIEELRPVFRYVGQAQEHGHKLTKNQLPVQSFEQIVSGGYGLELPHARLQLTFSGYFLKLDDLDTSKSNTCLSIQRYELTNRRW